MGIDCILVTVFGIKNRIQVLSLADLLSEISTTMSIRLETLFPSLDSKETTDL